MRSKSCIENATHSFQISTFILSPACNFTSSWRTGLRNVRIATGPFVCFLINAHNFGERIALERLSIQQVLPAVNDHPELCAPVADVIIADNLVPKKLSHAGQGVTEHRATNIPTCIGLATFGEPKSITMRCGESVSETPSRSSRNTSSACFSIAAGAREVDKAGAGDHSLFAKLGNIQMRN